MAILGFLLLAMAFYLLFGLIFAIPFLVRGVQKIDVGARGSKWSFRVIILPGVVVFWPLLLKKWLGVKKNSHD